MLAKLGNMVHILFSDLLAASVKRDWDSVSYSQIVWEIIIC